MDSSDRRALYEAAKNSSHHGTPDRGYYATVKDRHEGKLAAIAMARKIARRSFHILRAVNPDVVYTMP